MSALPTTREVPRPRLESRPLPAGWHHKDAWWLAPGPINAYVSRAWLVTSCGVVAWSAPCKSLTLADARDLVALLEWLEHERAVEAQDECHGQHHGAGSYRCVTCADIRNDEQAVEDWGATDPEERT